MHVQMGMEDAAIFVYLNHLIARNVYVLLVLVYKLMELHVDQVSI